MSEENKKESFAESAIANLREFNNLPTNEPIQHDTVRRMVVKGEIVYVHDSFTAPPGRAGRIE